MVMNQTKVDHTKESVLKAESFQHASDTMQCWMALEFSSTYLANHVKVPLIGSLLGRHIVDQRVDIGLFQPLAWLNVNARFDSQVEEELHGVSHLLALTAPPGGAYLQTVSNYHQNIPGLL